MIVPVPPQREQGAEIENIPWPSVSTPRPWQRGQTLGAVPGLAPVPWQVVQGVWVGTAIGTWAPLIACSKEIETSASRSRPRWAARWRWARPPPEPPNRLDRMSPKEGASNPPPPNPPLANGPLANGPVP